MIGYYYEPRSTRPRDRISRIAILRQDETVQKGEDLPHDCGAWGRTFGNGVTGAEFDVDCGGDTDRARDRAPADLEVRALRPSAGPNR